MVSVPKLRQVVKWKFVDHGIYWSRYVVAVSISQLMVQISVRIFWPEFVEGRGAYSLCIACMRVMLAFRISFSSDKIFSTLNRGEVGARYSELVIMRTAFFLDFRYFVEVSFTGTAINGQAVG